MTNLKNNTSSSVLKDISTGLNTKELFALLSFNTSHICPDRKPHDDVDYSWSFSYSQTSGIGTNFYVHCKRCGCVQDITDYLEW